MMTVPPPSASACFLVLPLLPPRSSAVRVVSTSRSRPEGRPFVALLRNRRTCQYLSSSKVPPGPTGGLLRGTSFWSPLQTSSCGGFVGGGGSYYALRSCRRERERDQGRGGTIKHRGRLRGLAGRVLVLLRRMGEWSRNSRTGTYSTVVVLVSYEIQQ